MQYNFKKHDCSSNITHGNNTRCKAKIIPINQLRNIPIDSATRYDNGRLRKLESQRHYTTAKVINDLAVEKYKANGKGINFNDLLHTRIATSKKQAQIKLKYHLKKKALFTISKNKPQYYYPESLRSEIINTKIKSIPIGVMGVPYNTNIPLSVADSAVIQTLEGYVLPMLPNIPLGIHKLELMIKINSEYYHEIESVSNRWNKGKEKEEIIGHALTRYRFYPNGAIMIFVQSSNNPFKLENEDDLAVIIAFLGQLRDRLILFLNDRHERVVPNIMLWELKQCDINRDVKVGEWLQFTGLKIQVRHACHLFRVYIKSKGRDTICRVEESLANTRSRKSAVETINEIFNPNDKVEKCLEEIYQAVQGLSIQLHGFDKRLNERIRVRGIP